MISEATLRRLTPQTDPIVDSPDYEYRLSRLSPEDSARRLALWASFIRQSLRDRLRDDEYLRRLVRSSGLIATGIFHVPDERSSKEDSGFPVVDGYQFGIALLRAQLSSETESTYLDRLALPGEPYAPPIMQFAADIRLQSSTSDGYVAALFHDRDGMPCGITARHVVQRQRLGQSVGIFCSDCHGQARLRRRAMGLIDAAVVEFPCGGPFHQGSASLGAAMEGSTVRMYLGNSGMVHSTVTASAQTPAQVMSAAMPAHFLVSDHGYRGDSGSLVASDHQPDDANFALVGMYLGKTRCKLKSGVFVNYGYGLDLDQAAVILDANIQSGDFND